MKSILNELREVAKIEGNYKETVETISFEDVFKEVEMTIMDLCRYQSKIMDNDK